MTGEEGEDGLPFIPHTGAEDRRLHAPQSGGRRGGSRTCRQSHARVLAALSLRGFPVVVTDLASAEMNNYAAKAFLATMITFINEAEKGRMIDKLLDCSGGCFNGKSLAALGVTFKPNTNDMREAPFLTLVPALVGGGIQVQVTNPHGDHEGKALLPGVTWCDEAYEAEKEADLVVVLTERNEFRALDLGRLRKGMRTAAMADPRNVQCVTDATRAGFGWYASVDCGGY